MGERSNVVIIHDRMQPRVITNKGKIPAGTFDLGVGIYTHWCGEELPGMVRNALRKAKPRWDDSAYCTRIIFDNLLTQAGDHDQETGWGLYPYCGENDLYEEDHETIYLTTGAKTVKIGRFEWTFENFLKQEL